MKFSRYEPRPIRFLELWEIGGWRLKVYGISYARSTPRSELIAAAKDTAARRLREHPTSHAHYGVGFLGIHDGRGENQVLLDLWINENELTHWYLVSPTSDPANLRVPEADHNSVCVWDLMVQCHERQAWLDCVLANPHGPDLETYLAHPS